MDGIETIYEVDQDRMVEYRGVRYESEPVKMHYVAKMMFMITGDWCLVLGIFWGPHMGFEL